VVADNASERRTWKGKLVVSENVTLDAVVQDPARCGRLPPRRVLLNEEDSSSPAESVVTR
jgi:hypothetical protein